MAKIFNQIGLTYDDVVLSPQYSDVFSRDDVDTSVTLVSGITLSSPLIATNMQSVISTRLCIRFSQLGGIALIHQFQSIEMEVKMLKEVKDAGARVMAAIGARGDYMERAKALIENGVDVIEMDTPHGHSLNMIDGIKNFKREFAHFPLIAGTVATSDGALALVKAGADSIKVGVGAGAACTTRINAGVGIPQFTAVMEISKALEGTGVTLIADAGIKNPGCFAKAIGAGGHVIMSGKIWAATTESNSELILKDGKEFKVYFGEASSMARIKRLENDSNYKGYVDKYVEGAEGLIPHAGPLEGQFNKFMSGLRSAMSYSGARTIDEFHQKAIFMQVTTNGGIESTPHGLVHKFDVINGLSI